MWSTAWSFSPEAIAPESYGLIDYLNGCGTGAGHGHGLYYNGGQGSYRKGTAIISFNDGGAGIHYFPHRGTSFTNPLLKDSVTFYSGKLNGNAVPHANVIMGGDAVSTNPITDGLYTYQRNPSGYDVKFGYSYGCTTPTISNSYIVGTVLISGCSTGFSPTTTLTFANNTIITTAESTEGGDPVQYLHAGSWRVVRRDQWVHRVLWQHEAHIKSHNDASICAKG